MLRRHHLAGGGLGKLSCYERWIVAFANILFRKGLLTPIEPALKMKEIDSRWPDA